jgi:hypothetical protein
MIDQYFGTKELYEVVLKANSPMNFGLRKIEAGEPVLYFDKITMSMLSENSRPILARGGWGNMPHVIWEDRSEVTFSFNEGVMSLTGLGILTSADVLNKPRDGTLYIPKKEGPFGPYYESKNRTFLLSKTPSLKKKIFCYLFDRDAIQKKVNFTLDGNLLTIHDDTSGGQYILDYYYEYEKDKESLIYLIEKERFNGTFLLEAKFYMKDENEGFDYTNILVMPKVRVVSNINLRLGERADPTVSVFNVIAMPEKTEDSDAAIMKIIHLNEDLDADI